MCEFFHGWRRMVWCSLLVLSGCSGSGPVEPHHKLVDNWLAESDTGFRVVKRYGIATSDDQLVKHLATKAAETSDPVKLKKILAVQSRMPFTATRQVFQLDYHPVEDALFIIRMGRVSEVYYLSDELYGQLFSEFAERAFP